MCEYNGMSSNTAEGAISVIESGMRIVVGHACGAPSQLVNALSKQYLRFMDLEVVHMGATGTLDYVSKKYEGHIRHNSLFVGNATRSAVNEGRASFTPSFFYEIPSLFREGHLPVDVALIQVSPPDEAGFCSYGVSNDYTKAAAEAAKIIIAQINQKMPRVLGDNFIHISDIDYCICTDEPIETLKPLILNEVTLQIGKYCAMLIPNGSTLQMGIGGIPDAVLYALQNKKDLGIHSELISDGIVELMKAGIVNNRLKNHHSDKIVATFAMGTEKLYDFLHNNHNISFMSVDYVNHPLTIAKHHQMVSINACIEVDLMGQVNSESIGGKQYSGTGGQVDFIRGARLSEQGKSIIALPSTAKNGMISRIVPMLETGTVVTTTRNDIEFVVTEFGIAELRGKTISQRAEALIKIAHPNFRDELKAQWMRRF